MRHMILMLLILFFIVPLQAQDDPPAPYEIALQRIEEARISGATVLDLSELGLTELPLEIRELVHLDTLLLDGNPLVDPPPEIVGQGTLAVLDYLQEKYERQRAEKIRWMILTSLGGWIVIFMLFGYGYRQGRYRRKKKREL